MARSTLLAYGITVFLIASSATACDLSGFDQGSPNSEGDNTRPTSKANFEWGSDADPWGNNYVGARSWHYVRNTHENRLSLNWDKVGLLIPFDEPLVTDDCRSVIDYGNENAFIIDSDAPIQTSNDGEKAAVAFVRSEQAADEGVPRIMGAQIRAEYRTDDGEKNSAVGRLVAYFFPDDQAMTVEIYSGEGEESIAFRPGSFGLDIEIVAGQLEERGIGIMESVSLNDFSLSNELSAQAFEGVASEEYIQIATKEPVSLTFTEVFEIPSERTSLLLFSPEGSLLAAKRLSTTPLLANAN